MRFPSSIIERVIIERVIIERVIIKPVIIERVIIKPVIIERVIIKHVIIKPVIIIMRHCEEVFRRSNLSFSAGSPMHEDRHNLYPDFVNRSQ